MPQGLQNLRFHVVEEGASSRLASLARGPAVRGLGDPGDRAAFHTDEAAARYYLSKFLRDDERPALRGLALSAPAVVPDLRVVGTHDVPQTQTRILRFEQTQATIPIFGSMAVVELGRDRELISLDAEVADVGGVSPIANLSSAAALEALARTAGVSREVLSGVEAPQLTFFYLAAAETWHLAYHFRRVPAAPPEFHRQAAERRSHGHGLGKSPRTIHPLLDYLVDAHSGEALLYFSSTPMLDVPAKCKGIDELAQPAEFHGRRTAGGGFEMWDPLRSIGTYDLELGDIETAAFPATPVQSPSSDWQSTNTAAVSAHLYATAVHKFYQSVLSRDSVDDKGMELVSAVRCTYSEEGPPPVWRNAVWYNNRMFYGQSQEAGGKLASFSRYLDVIAHELTHGVTEHSSNLVYAGQSGALNESLSDIFGVMIKNWHAKRWDSVAGWDWEIGAGLGRNGLPLRDLSDPRRTGDPDHMDQYLDTLADNGGVHTNSNIHNKAAYNVLTAKDAAGGHVFTPEESATLYYLCLARLNATASFAKALQVLLAVANTYYAGDDIERRRKTEAIREAYRRVGIE